MSRRQRSTPPVEQQIRRRSDPSYFMDGDGCKDIDTSEGVVSQTSTGFMSGLSGEEVAREIIRGHEQAGGRHWEVAGVGKANGGQQMRGLRPLSESQSRHGVYELAG